MNIYDIAKAAGVSITTVSRVINGSGKVSQGTRQRVLEVMEAADYVPNAFAQGLGLGTMRMIGILCTDVSDIFYAAMVSNLEQLLGRHGLGALLCCTGDGLADKQRGLEELLGRNVDAVILVGSGFIEKEDNGHLLAAAARRPLFCVNGVLEGENIYCVYADEKRAMYENAIHLLDAGCRHIAYFYDAHTQSGLAKLAGLRKALEERLGEVPQALFVRVRRELDEIVEAAARLMDSHPVDGILASEDVFAVGACKAAAHRGLRLPAIGFNNSILAQCASPSLTSMDNMLTSLCGMTVSHLTEVLGGGEVPRSVSLSGRLVRRETFPLDPPAPHNTR